MTKKEIESIKWRESQLAAINGVKVESVISIVSDFQKTTEVLTETLKRKDTERGEFIRRLCNMYPEKKYAIEDIAKEVFK